jgi:hypothetical protein
MGILFNAGIVLATSRPTSILSNPIDAMISALPFDKAMTRAARGISLPVTDISRASVDEIETE